MKHCTSVIRTLSLAIALAPLGSSAAAAQTIIYPPSGTAGGNYGSAVISDGYAATESWMFDRAVNSLVLNGLMADPFYSSKGSAFTIQKIFTPASQSGQSAFGIVPNYD